MVEWFRQHPKCVGASGHIVNDRKLSRGRVVFRRAFDLGTGDGKLRRSGDALYLYHPAVPTLVDYVSGSNMVWRRNRLDGLRFDESLEGYAYMEDVDFSLAAGRNGDLWMVPAARLQHAKSATSRVPPRSYVQQVFANGAYLFAKHRPASGLSRAAYARRVLGRCLAYAGVSLRSRSREPIVGMQQGLAAVPRMLRAGRDHNLRP